MGQIAGSRIEWATHTSNPVKGRCFGDCPYCYMRAIYKRFPRLDHAPEFDGDECSWKPPSGSLVFIGSRLDMFHPKMPDAWICGVIDHVRECDDAHWAFLTKYPERLYKFHFPDNVLLGTTWDGRTETMSNVVELVANAPRSVIAFVCFEPLLGFPHSLFTRLGKKPDGAAPGRAFIEWVIIGGDSTPGAKKPPVHWADKLMADAEDFGIPVWLKDTYKYEGVREIPKQRPITVLYERRRKNARKHR